MHKYANWSKFASYCKMKVFNWNTVVVTTSNSTSQGRLLKLA